MANRRISLNEQGTISLGRFNVTSMGGNRFRLRWLPAGLLCLVIVSPARAGDGDWPPDLPFRLIAADYDRQLDSLFMAEDNGWLGSDVAHSIVLSDTSTLWLFGDTFLGKVRDGKRIAKGRHVNSTVALRDRRIPPPGGVTFYWKRRLWLNRSLFPHQPGTPGKYYWVTNGLLLPENLVLLGFAMAQNAYTWWVDGTILITIPNPHDPPPDWRPEYTDFGLGDNHRAFLSAVYYHDPYIYFMGYDDLEGQRRMVLARARAEDMLKEKTSAALDYWVEQSGEYAWSSQPENLAPLFVPGVTETNIQYVPQWETYFCTTYRPNEDAILLTSAPELTGPWTEPVVIFHNPDHQTMTYAARLHPHLSTRPGELVISFVTAPQSLDLANEPLSSYRPRFIKVLLERTRP